MRLFVKHPDFYIVMEGLLARKAPSPKDLQQLLPHVWWKGCKDETASEERLRASVSIITTTVAKVKSSGAESVSVAACLADWLPVGWLVCCLMTGWLWAACWLAGWRCMVDSTVMHAKAPCGCHLGQMLLQQVH
jgi:hypothetical protein